MDFELVRPADGDITQYFGNIQPDGLEHAGQDYAYYSGGQVHDAVYAAADGVVLFAGDSRNLGWPNLMYLNPDFNRSDSVDSSAGNYIIIQHHRNKIPVALTGYGHLESFEVKAGDIVSAGNRIATIGDSGNTRGKHLHFDLMFYPLNYNTPTYGKSDPNPYFAGNIQFQSITTPSEEEDFMGGKIDAEQAEDIAKRAAALVVEALNGHVLIHPVQAESIVQATTARTVEGVDARNQGKLIDRQQADDIARAAARYTQENPHG